MLGDVIRNQAQKNGVTSVRDILPGNESVRGRNWTKSDAIVAMQNTSPQQLPSKLGTSVAARLRGLLSGGR